MSIKNAKCPISYHEGYEEGFSSAMRLRLPSTDYVCDFPERPPVKKCAHIWQISPNLATYKCMFCGLHSYKKE